MTSTNAVSRFEVRTIHEHLVAPVRPVIVVLASAVAFVLTLCVGLLVSLLPIVRHALSLHLDVLQGGLTRIASVNASPSRGGRTALLVAQTALATMALIGGGLLVHSFLNLARVDPGYEATHLLTFNVRSRKRGRRSGVPNTLTKALPLTRNVDMIVTGHSGVAKPEDLAVHRDFMRDFLEATRRAKKAGQTAAAAAKAWKLPARYVTPLSA